MSILDIAVLRADYEDQMKHEPNSKAAKRFVGNRPTLTAFDLMQAGLGHSTIHVNLEQQMIITTEDRLRLHLNELLDATKYRQQWQAPAGMLITELTAVVAANFHETFGISGGQWENFFRTLIVGTIFWLLVVLIRGRGASSADSLIARLKSAQPTDDRSATKGFQTKL